MRAVRLSRRRFLGLAAAGALWPAALRADDEVRIGLLVPADPAAATALERGATLGLDDANALAQAFGKRLRLVTEPAPDAAAAVRSAGALTGTGALAVVGGAGQGIGDALADVAAGGTVVFNVGAPDDRLRGERCAASLFHVRASVTMHVDAAARWLAERRKLLRWAIAGDGSARGREIGAAMRRAAARAGATVTDGGGDVLWLAMEDAAAAAALARARADGRPPDRVVGIGGDAALALAPDATAGVWAVSWHHELERFSGRELNARFRRRFGAPLTEVGWAAWAALKLAGEAVVRGHARDGRGLVAFLDTTPPFDGHKGEALTFRRWDRQLRQPLHIIGPRRREDVAGRRGPFEVLADVGTGDLDSLGASAADTRCRLSQ